MKAHEITPRHEVTDTEHLASIVASMERDGWRGRPLLVADNGQMRALTGSHRHAAAAETDIDIPVVVVPWETWEVVSSMSCAIEDFRCDDIDLLVAFEAVAEEGLPMAQEAADLMRQEIAANSSN